MDLPIIEKYRLPQYMITILMSTHARFFKNPISTKVSTPSDMLLFQTVQNQNYNLKPITQTV